MQKLQLLRAGKRTKIYHNLTNGDYVVHVLRTHNFDGIIEACWDTEIFKDDGQHSGGGVCTHQFPIYYTNGDKRENAFAFADLYENRGKRGV